MLGLRPDMRSRQISARSLSNRSALQPPPKTASLGARAPGANTPSAHRQGAKKNAAPYRRAHEASPGFRPAKQKRRGMGHTPPDVTLPKTPPAIHAHCLLLFLFCAACRAEYGGSVVRLAVPARLLFSLQLVIRFSLPRPARVQTYRDQGARARQDGICNSKCGAAPSRRAREIPLSEPNDHRMGKVRTEPAWTSGLRMSTAFHAHCMLPFL